MFWGIVLKLIAGHSLCFILTILVFQMFMDVGALNCYSCKPCPNAGANITCKADEPNCLIAKGSSGLYDLTLRQCSPMSLFEDILDEMMCKNFSSQTFDGITFYNVRVCLCGWDNCNQQMKGSSASLGSCLTLYALLFFSFFMCN